LRPEDAALSSRRNEMLVTTRTSRMTAWRTSSAPTPILDTMTHASSSGSTVARVNRSATGLVIRSQSSRRERTPRNAFRAP